MSGKPVLLITGAGGGGASNLVGTLRARDRFTLIGTDLSSYKAARAPVDRAYVVPPARDPRYAEELGKVIAHERPDLVIPTNDAEVEVLAENGEHLNAPLFSPGPHVIRRCQDKWAFHEFARSNDIRTARTYRVARLSDVTPIFAHLERRPLWCRLRRGAGSLGATKVKEPEQAEWWIRYWVEMRGAEVSDFLLSEFLPGRDFACQSLWFDGDLVLMKAAERLEYIDRAARPSNMSSSPELARTIFDPPLFDFCRSVVRKVSAGRPHGIYAIDLKEDAAGRLCVTEVNAGRFFMITNLFNEAGRHSMVDAFVALALCERSEVEDPFDFEEKFLVRALDTLPTVLTPRELKARLCHVPG